MVIFAVLRVSVSWEEILEKLLFDKRSVSKIYDFPGGSAVKYPSANPGDVGWIPGSGRSPGEGNGNPLQCSCLENSRDREPGGLPSVGSHRVGHD